MSVAIIGTVAFDSIETPKGQFDRILGGSGSYSGTAASLFAPVHLISVIGQDFPDEHLTFFQKRGMNTAGIQKLDGNTFHWKGYYKADMNQAFTVSTDLNVLLQFDPQIPAEAKNSKIVFLANIDPVLQKKAIEQFNNPELIVLDSMNYWIENHLDSLKETLKLVDVLILNDQEIRMLTGLDNVIQAMAHVLTLGPKRVIVKKGENGSVMYNGTEFFSCPAFPLDQLVDPTGAGDSFAGGFAGYLAKAPHLTEDIFRQAVVVGTLISSHTVRDFSLNQLKTLTWDDLQRQFEQFKGFAMLPKGI
jgi:sugar/nucleoside kinase (ribokinase family)